MHEFVSRFVHEHGLVLLGCASVAAILAWCCHARLRHLRARERLSREVEDALVQNAQGLIINVHGIVKNLAATDPLRQGVELALDRADELLSKDRDRVQDLRTQADLDGGALAQNDAGAVTPPEESAVINENAAGKSRLLSWLSFKRRR